MTRDEITDLVDEPLAREPLHGLTRHSQPGVQHRPHPRREVVVILCVDRSPYPCHREGLHGAADSVAHHRCPAAIASTGMIPKSSMGGKTKAAQR